ncbi:MAG: AAC(3) family N-acetyltransferase [Anaerolineales bacterium]|nr:MAG: AAC(3) family N-acetyltransferase [Anaerolineales bacterium]
MDQDQTVQTIAGDLEALGLPQGSAVLVHSSLSALGYVEGGPETVIQGLLQALGPEGTLLIPALSYEIVTPKNPVFDVRSTPSNIGIIPEYFRKRHGTRRSIHPTHSVCAVGPLTGAFLDQHDKDSTPCGAHSPFRALRDLDGYILMLGCGLKPDTSMHAIEELLQPPHFFGTPFVYMLTLPDGKQKTKLYTPHNFSGWEQRYDRVAQYMPKSGLCEGKVLDARTYLIHAPTLWEVVYEVMQKDPLAFVARVNDL